MLHLSVFLLTIAAEAPAEVRDKVEIMVEDAAPPWSKADGTGLANDIIEAAFGEMGIAIKKNVVPYSRCKRSVLNGSAVACASMTNLPEYADKVGFSANTLIVLNIDVFENRSKPLPRPPRGTCSLPKGSVAGIVESYEYPPEVWALAGQGTKFETANSDINSLKMLAAGRLDAAIIVTNNLEPRNQKAIDSQTKSQVEFAFPCGQENGTIGFSLRHPQGKSLLEIYEKGYKRIRDNGKLKGIERRWTANP